MDWTEFIYPNEMVVLWKRTPGEEAFAESFWEGKVEDVPNEYRNKTARVIGALGESYGINVLIEEEKYNWDEKARKVGETILVLND